MKVVSSKNYTWSAASNSRTNNLRKPKIRTNSQTSL